MNIKVTQATAPVPGAVAVLHLRGDIDAVLRTFEPPATCPTGDLRLVRVPDIDTALFARTASDEALLMPHGGPAIVQALLHRLGGAPGQAIVLPAASRAEACMCKALSAATTTQALDLLLHQPARWAAHDGTWTPADAARSTRLNHLLQPPTIAVIGPPNIGKSTLANALAGRHAARVHDAPGTTRDHVGVMLHLDGLCVHWLDMPGFRHDTDDPVEQAAIATARERLQQADLCVHVADATSDWALDDVPPTFKVGLRSDLGLRSDTALDVCAPDGTGLDELAAAVRRRLLSDADLADLRPWAFHESLVPRAQSPIAE